MGPRRAEDIFPHGYRNRPVVQTAPFPGEHPTPSCLCYSARRDIALVPGGASITHARQIEAV